MTGADGAELAAGSVVVAAAVYDLFQSVVVPRPSVGRLALAPIVVRRSWTLWRALGLRAGTPARREAILGVFGPLAVLVLLVVWVSMLVVGYGLILFALRDQIRPQPGDVGTAFYLSALSLLTLGFGDIVPVEPAARVAVVTEAAAGLGVVALVISLLFSLFSAFQRREALVIVLDAAAGAPPSGVHLLEACAGEGMQEELTRTFVEWRAWAADVLESHLAYPILTYFRSSHDNEAWINTFGAVMDAAVLALTTLDGVPRAPARVMLKVGGHLVEDLTWYFRVVHEHEPYVEREEFEEACDRLAAAGYAMRARDRAWEDFAALRGQYAPALTWLARHLAMIPAQWIGDRSYVPHTRVDGSTGHRSR